MGAIMVYGRGRTDVFPSDKIKQVVVREGGIELRMADSTPYTIPCGVREYNERTREWTTNTSRAEIEREVEKAFIHGISRFSEIS